MLHHHLPRLLRLASFAGDEYIQIPHRLPPAPQRPSRCNFFYSLHCAKMLRQSLSRPRRHINQEPPRNFAVTLNRLQQLLLMLLAHPWQDLNLPLASQLLHAVHVRHLVSAPDQGNRLRPQALNLQQIQHRRLVLRQHLRMNANRPRRKKLLQVRQHPSTDAGNFQKLFRFLNQIANLLGQRLNRLGGAAVRPDPEHVLAVNFQQVRRFVQQTCNCFIFHGIPLPIVAGTAAALHHPLRSRTGGPYAKKASSLTSHVRWLALRWLLGALFDPV